MKSLLLTSFFLLILNQVFPQRINAAPQQIDKAKETPSKTIQSSNASGFLSYNSFTKLNAANDGVSAEGSINYLASHAWNFNLSVSTPVTNKSQQVKPLTIAGLSGNSTLSGGAQKIWWGNRFSYDQTSYNNAIKAIGKDIMSFNYDDLTIEEQRKFEEKANIDWGTAFLAGGKAGIEQSSFEYIIDPVTLNSEKNSKTSFKATGTLGMLHRRGILALTFTFKDGYQADDPVKYYIPINNTGVLIEKNLSQAAPVRQNTEELRFEYLSSGYSGSRLRINPNVNIEFNQQLFSFEFPVYFLTSNEERTNFNGGIYAGYVSDKNFKFNTDNNNFGFGVFIGVSFTNLFQ